MQAEVSQNITVEKEDLYSLLSFTHFVQGRHSSDGNLERRTALSDGDEPQEYASRRHPWRLAKCLDSLANLCVSQMASEVLATGLRYGKVNDQQTLEIIIAGNNDVSQQACNHLEQIWGLLRQISETVSQKTGHQRDGNSPVHLQDQTTKSLIEEFQITALKFSYNRIQRKLFKKMEMFDSETLKTGQDKIKEAVFQLANILRDGNINKPLSAMTDDDLADVCALLHYLSSKISEHFPKLDGSKSSPFVRYLHKIEGIAADWKQLCVTACSPRYIDLFSAEPNIISLRSMPERISTLPKLAKEWEARMKRSLSYYNCNSNEYEKKRWIDKFPLDCLDIARQNQKKVHKAVVHCEVKLALYLSMEERDAKPAPYPYIGVSKLSCTGCSKFLVAFNKVHGTNFLTKGQHGKAYFPWGFPKDCPRAKDVLEKQYEELNDWFVSWYTGFGWGPLAPDSTGQSNPSGSTPVELSDSADRVRKYLGEL